MPFRLIAESLFYRLLPFLAVLVASMAGWYFGRKKLLKSGAPQDQIRARDRAFWGLVLFCAASLAAGHLLPPEAFSRIPLSALGIIFLIVCSLAFLLGKKIVLAGSFFVAALFLLFQVTLIERLLSAGPVAKFSRLISPFTTPLAVAVMALGVWLALKKPGRGRT